MITALYRSMERRFRHLTSAPAVINYMYYEIRILWQYKNKNKKNNRFGFNLMNLFLRNISIKQHSWGSLVDLTVSILTYNVWLFWHMIISYRNTCAPSQESDQSALPRRLSRGFAVRLKLLWIIGHAQRSMKTDQSGHMCMLIWVFTGRTCNVVVNAVSWLKYM